MPKEITPETFEETSNMKPNEPSRTALLICAHPEMAARRLQNLDSGQRTTLP